jgi:hypothetical protein
MPAPRTKLLALGLLAALALSPAAGASIKIAGNAHHPVLRVNGAGYATVIYTKNGRRMSAVVTPSGRTIWGRRAGGRDVSVPTGAVAIPMVVTVRQTPDGRFWALQMWKRLRNGPVELRFSRWRGQPTLLQMWARCCKWRSEQVQGRATFHGRAIYGYGSTPSGVPTDRFGRNVYIDTFRRGRWVRCMGILTHRPTGRFSLWVRPYWRGTQYRGRMIGPNWGRTLAPDAEGWTASAL